MSKKKRKKKEEQLDEFRKLNDKEGKGHPRYLFKKRGKTYKAIGITHGEHTDGKKNIPLTANPDPTDKKPAHVQKPAKPAAPKKPTAAKAPKLKPIKHSDEYENGTGGDKNHIIVVGKKQQKPRASRRELKRVRSGGYTVFDGKRAGKTFETAEEAANYAVDVLIRTGEAVPVERTDRQVTHTFKPEEQKKKK